MELDYDSTLGLDCEASWDEIHTEYRGKASKEEQEVSTTKSHILQEAYEELGARPSGEKYEEVCGEHNGQRLRERYDEAWEKYQKEKKRHETRACEADEEIPRKEYRRQQRAWVFKYEQTPC
ncbi:hypothetical protein K432DRAFT_393307 [Lepidopterella palustris CBS 459.81]|uniref:J domain-containing protein n=1 Tax=Lepidopterella palustris CBS 459.81 TaxID=1314670 RepID=A0A8E2JF60_9PEZI|nr:hypothetical protein K432DRAFT_393307 [Lepidopterella palustris CBS 459.81]